MNISLKSSQVSHLEIITFIGKKKKNSSPTKKKKILIIVVTGFDSSLNYIQANEG